MISQTITGALEMFDGQRFAKPAQLEMRSEMGRLSGYRRAVAGFLLIRSHFGTRLVLQSLDGGLRPLPSYSLSVFSALFGGGATGWFCAFTIFFFLGRLRPKVPRWILPRRER